MKNRWKLDEEVKDKYISVVTEFINVLESLSPKGTSAPLEINLSDTELNPHTLMELLVGLGYEESSRGDNGWQLDYWIIMKKAGAKTLWINGKAILFELKLSEYV